MNKGHDITIECKVAFLRRPQSYPQPTSAVFTVETHKSLVFMTDRFCYKLKKAIRYDSADFRPLATRHRNCLEEVRLNRRLAPDVYLGVVPLTMEPDGQLALGGSGDPVDWLVKMRRLPGHLMLDRKIRDGTLAHEEVRRLAYKLARFYQASPPAGLDPSHYREILWGEIDINARDLEGSSVETGPGQARLVIKAQLDFLNRRVDLFDRRVQEGRIVEGHGDLRPEHVCLEPDPVIFDCLEFNPSLRTLDAADELAFLALQCERFDASWVGTILFDTYAGVTGDDPPDSLIRFYKSYRAATWARLAVWRARDLNDDARAKWIARGRDYLDRATAYAESLI